MKNILIIIILSLITMLNAMQKENTNIVYDSSTIKAISSFNTRLSLVEQNQTNYKIEKDLVREFYSSSLQTVSIISTIVLALGTVIGIIFGIFGIKNINDIKNQFNIELEKLRGTSDSFNNKVNSLDGQIEQAKQRLENIVKINERQDQRLKIIEIQEKVVTLMKNFDYSLALDFANAGLEIDSTNSRIISLKLNCLMSLRLYDEVIKFTDYALNVEPNNVRYITNKIEYLLIKREAKTAMSLLKDKEDIVVSNYGKYLKEYFEIVKVYIDGTKEELIDRILNIEDDKKAVKAIRIKNWSFQDLFEVIDNDNDRSKVGIIYNLIKYFSGEFSFDEMKNQLTNGQRDPAVVS